MGWVPILMGDFVERIEELITHVGTDIVGTVEVDQIYAHYQHEDLTLKHPRGGGPLYLTRPLLDNYRFYLEEIASVALEEGGLDASMAEAMENLSGKVAEKAPIEFGSLRESGHPSVRHRGMIV